MVDIGTTSPEKLVNSRLAKVYVRPSSTDIEWLQLQERNLSLNNQLLLEPTTSGGLASFTGFIDSTLSATVLFTTDIPAATGGLIELNTKTNGELPKKTWRMKVTDFNGTTQTWEFTAKLEAFENVGFSTGGMKFNLVLRILTDFVAGTIT